jgi:hypothetical protein
MTTCYGIRGACVAGGGCRAAGVKGPFKRLSESRSFKGELRIRRQRPAGDGIGWGEGRLTYAHTDAGPCAEGRLLDDPPTAVLIATGATYNPFHT